MTLQRRPTRPAFTLLELLLALAMTAMLSLSLYMAMSSAMRARDTATASVNRMRAAVLAADLIGKDLESVLPPTGILAGPFIGQNQGGAGAEADDLEFACLGADPGLADQPLGEGIRRVELTVRTDVNPPALVRRVTRNLLAQTQPQPEEEILCRNVRSFAVRYYDGATWQDTWDSTTLGDILPFAVEITLEVVNPADRPGQQTSTYKVVRTTPLACAKSADTSTTGGTGP